MAESDRPQVYLLTPPAFEFSTFPGLLSRLLDKHEVACIRLAMATRDEDRLSRAADLLRDVAHAHDVALVIETHVALAQRLGLDGVHLTNGARSVRKTRKTLGNDAIIGAFCHASRHDGMTAGEAGADYVAFGPAGASALGDGTLAGPELFAWWSEMIEVPVVAEGNLDADLLRTLAPVTDFFGIGEEIWRTEDPATALDDLVEALR